MSDSTSNEQRQLLARVTIKAKLNILKKYLLLGIPAKMYVPKSIAQFRNWEDESLGLLKIGSPNTLNLRSSPKNADLIDELNGILGKVKRKAIVLPKIRSTSEKMIENLRGQLEQQKSINSELASRLHEVRSDLISKNILLVTTKKTAERSTAEMAKLRKKFIKVTSKPVLSVVKNNEEII